MSSCSQLSILLWKSFKIRLRNPLTTIFEIFLPLVLPMLITYLLRDTSLTSSSEMVGQQTAQSNLDAKELKKYISGLAHHFYYYQSDQLVQEFISELKNISGFDSVEKMDDLNDMKKRMKDSIKGNHTLNSESFGIYFDGKVTNYSDLLSYHLITTKSEHSFEEIALNEVFLSLMARKYNAPKLKERSFKIWPFPSEKASLPITSDIIVSVTLFFAYIVFCPLICKRICDEKEIKIKELLKMMGMSDFIFWSHHFVNYLIVGTFHALVFAFFYCYGWQALGIGTGKPLFDDINVILFFIILMVYVIQTIMLCMAFTTIFNKPIIAVIVMTILYIVSYVAILVTLHPTFGKSPTESNLYRIISSLHPSAGLMWDLLIVYQIKASGAEVGFKQLIENSEYFRSISFVEVMGTQLLSCILYAILIWYLDAVWPFQYGIPKPLYFPCLPSYYCPHKQNTIKDIESEDSNTKTEHFESEPKDTKKCISLKNVSKEFSGGKGVHNMSFNIYDNQLTALLGHNGAGKTTTMNMITGIYPPTSGTILVNGFNILSATFEARKSIGLCPQENIIYNDLTVREHLKLFAVLKGFPRGELNQEIDKIVAMIRLVDKQYTKSSALSGGMKRKLCLGIAMIGGSHVLILDEPTSGMDPEARRAIWDVLQDIRKHKTILLTTHYMEEADALSDRIAIMSEGQMKCCGSPMFLKKTFGAGYHLRISKAKNFNKGLLEEVLKKHLPESRLKSEINIEIIYSLESEDPSKQTNKSVFPNLFTELEDRKSEIGIDSYGISITTMEDVFIKVGSDDEIEKNAAKSEEKVRIEMSSHSYEKSVGSALFRQRICGLLLKRFHFGRRYWPMILFQILIPGLIFFGLFATDKSLKSDSNRKSVKLDLKEIYGKTYGFVKSGQQIQNFSKIYANNTLNHGMNTTILNSNEDINKWLIQESKSHGMEAYKSRYIIGGSIESGDKLDIHFWFNPNSKHSLLLSINLMYESLIGYLIPKISSVTIEPTIDSVLELLKEDVNFVFTILSIIVCCLLILPLSTPFLGASYVLYPIQEQESKSKFLQLMTGLSSFTFWLSNYIFDFFYHLMAITVLLVVIYFLDANEVFFYEMDSFLSLLLLLLLFGFSSIALAYCFSFWFRQPSTGFVILVVLYLLFGFIVNLIYSGLHCLKYFLPLLQTILIEKWYWDLFRLVPILSINFGLTKLYSIGTLKHFCRRSLKNSNITETCSPTSKSLVIGCCPGLCKALNSCFQEWKGLSFERTGIAMDLVFMLLIGILFFAIIMLFEGEVRKCLKLSLNPDLNLFINKNEDSDVTNERQFVDSLVKTNNFKDEGIVVVNLTKNFGSFRAVNHLTFCVHKNECFGLLGVNGAGKTTTFSMLTGDIAPGDGSAFIETTSLREKTHSYQQMIGYCPQFDAILDRLTGEEMLYLFARLRGIPSGHLRQEVDSVIEVTDLKKHSKYLTMTYSGGNKRKLSLGLSIIGSPSLVFLDEPTAGVDPVARRKIWRTLNELKNSKHSSIILTSHSMEESEALCARIAIMVSGEFKCLGSTQQLRSKFGQGFTLIIKLKAELASNEKYLTNVFQYIVQRLPSAVLKDRHQCILQFHITDPSVKWSSLFAVMQSAQKDLDLEDYNLSDTTLEQIFLTFAQKR